MHRETLHEEEVKKMPERTKIQRIPVKVYRTADRLMVAAPMPGLQPEDIRVEVTDDNRLLLQGELRGVLKDLKDILLDEWSVGGYARELTLPTTVDGEYANLSYGNGVLVATLPVSEQTVPAQLTLEKVGVDRGERVGHSGHAL